jgi:ornithine--oxo-acid transaminase
MMNSGVEAGESAVKFARRWGYMVKKVKPDMATVLFAKGNFWGRTIAACGSSDDPDRYRNFGPFEGLRFELVEYGSVPAL